MRAVSRKQFSAISLFMAISALALLGQSCVQDLELPAEDALEWIPVPIPPIGTSLDVWTIASDGNGSYFAGTQAGSVLWRSADGGSTWTCANSGMNTLYRVSSILIRSDSAIFAGEAGGGVFLSRDAGEQWTQVNNHLTDLDVSALAEVGGRLLAGTSGGRIFVSTNDGGVWSEIGGETIEQPIIALVADPTGVVYAGCGTQGVFFSADSGATWTAASTGLGDAAVCCLTTRRNGFVLAGTNSGGIFRSPGRGAPFTHVFQGADSAAVRSIATDEAGRIFAGTTRSGVLFSEDGGDSWARRDRGMQHIDITSLICVDGILLAGTLDSYGIYRSLDRGISWRMPETYNGRYLSHMWSSIPFSVDGEGTLYLSDCKAAFKSRDGGNTWTRMGDGIQRCIRCFAFPPESSSILAGASFGIEISNDGGDTWSRVDTFTAFDPSVSAFEIAPDGTVFGLAFDAIVRSTDNGASWHRVFSSPGYPLNSIAAGRGSRIFVGTEKGVLRSTDGGGTWRPANAPLVAFQSIDANRMGDVYALCRPVGSMNALYLLCSHDDGDTWEQILLSSGYQRGSFDTPQVIVAPAGKLAVALISDGILLVSNDGFSSWARVPNPFGAQVDSYSNLILGLDRHLYITSSNSPAVLRTQQTLY